MRIFSGLDDLEVAVGEHLGYSDWHTITQHDVNLFAEATGDLQWIHTDPSRAEQGPFGGTIAHGYFTLSLIPRLIGQILRVEGISMGLNYGANRLRFPAPVLVGSRVRAGTQIVALERTMMGARMTALTTVEIGDVDKPACVVENVFVYVP